MVLLPNTRLELAMRLFDHPAISPEELASLKRVFDVLCPTAGRQNPSEEVESIARTLFILYENGMKDEGMLLAELERRAYLAIGRRLAEHYCQDRSSGKRYAFIPIRELFQALEPNPRELVAFLGAHWASLIREARILGGKR